MYDLSYRISVQEANVELQKKKQLYCNNMMEALKICAFSYILIPIILQFLVRAYWSLMHIIISH